MHGVRITSEQYTQAVVELQSQQPTRPTAGQSLKHERQEFDLKVQHLLGCDFPRSDALWTAHRSIDRYRGILHFLGWRGRRILLRHIYRKVLNEDELGAWLGDEEPSDRP